MPKHHSGLKKKIKKTKYIYGIKYLNICILQFKIIKTFNNLLKVLKLTIVKYPKNWEKFGYFGLFFLIKCNNNPNRC